MYPFRTALGPTHSPAKCVMGIFTESKAAGAYHWLLPPI